MLAFQVMVRGRKVVFYFLNFKHWSLRDSNSGPSGVTVSNVTVSTDGPRSQVKPAHPRPLAFFSNRHFNMFSQPTKKKFRTYKFFMLQRTHLFPLGPKGLFSASAVFRWNFSKSKPKIRLNHLFRPVGVRPKKSWSRESCGNPW